jgi:hypothetical protein
MSGMPLSPEVMATMAMTSASEDAANSAMRMADPFLCDRRSAVTYYNIITIIKLYNLSAFKSVAKSDLIGVF